MSKRAINVFAADDDEDDISLFKDSFSASDINATTTAFKNSRKLCSYFENSIALPDVIYFGIDMPLIDGTACLKQLRKSTSSSDMPIVMYSTSVYQKYG